MFDNVSNRVKKSAGAYFLSGVLAVVGCTEYIPMDVKTARAEKKRPAAVEEIVRGDWCDGSIRTQGKNGCSYGEYSVELLKNGMVETELVTIESAVKNSKDWVILYPILGGQNLLIVGYIARNVFAPEGINSAILLRKEFLIPYETKYRTLKSDNPNIIDFDDYNRSVVKDTRRVVEYLKGRGVKNLGLMGISLGGIQVAGCAAFVPESKINIVIMGGGNLAELVMNSQEGIVVDYKNKLIQEYGSETNVRDALSKLASEPLHFAPYLRTDKMRMVITTKDDVVQTRCQWLLYEALGRPTTLTVKANHYWLFVHYCRVKDFIVEEIKKSFSE